MKKVLIVICLSLFAIIVVGCSINDTSGTGDILSDQQKVIEKYLAENGYIIVPNSGAESNIRLVPNFQTVTDGIKKGEYLKQSNEFSKQNGLDFSSYLGKEATMWMFAIQGKKSSVYEHVILLLDKTKIIGFWVDNKNTSYALMLNILDDSK